ncbi:hypothetical protein lerEdw1_012820 [Lerista edwardsae]|nr:hypothetical protein lerEdw1_012820 [Lerista edwardsae]
MSAQANLAGLFPPIGKQIWSHKIAWQPIPVHTVPLKDDRLLNFPIKNCSRFDRLEQETLRGKDVQDKVKSKMRTRGLRLPTWANWAVLGEMEEMILFNLRAYFGLHKPRLKAQVQGGVLVKDILEKITLAAQDAFEHKMVMYSAVMTQLSSSLGCHKTSTHTIEMYFRDYNIDEDPEMVTLPGCTDACPLEKFKQLVAPIIPDNLEQECNKI